MGGSSPPNDVDDQLRNAVVPEDLPESKFWATMHEGARAEIVEEIVASILEQCDVTGDGRNDCLSRTELGFLDQHVRATPSL